MNYIANLNSFNPPAAAEPLGQAMRQTGRTWQMALGQALESVNLTVLQWVVLELVVDAPGLSQTALAKGVGVEGPSLVRVLDELEKDGWLQRKPDATDRRVKRVYLGDNAGPRIKRAQYAADGVRARAVSKMSTEDQEQLLRLVRMLSTALREA